MAWIVGFVLLLGSFNHVIVGTLELFFGIRSGADIGYGQLFSNLGIAIASNLVGGLVLVTFARSAQALGASPD
jgi:formate/nitrite transporter FocA (FNT family)